MFTLLDYSSALEYIIVLIVPTIYNIVIIIIMVILVIILIIGIRVIIVIRVIVIKLRRSSLKSSHKYTECRMENDWFMIAILCVF